MTKTITFFLALCLIFGLAVITYAHTDDAIEEVIEDETVEPEDLDSQEPNLLPGNPLYFVKEWGRGLQSFFSFGQLKKTETAQKIANERLLELRKLAEEGKVDQKVLEKATEKYEKSMEKIKNRAEKIKENAEDSEKVSKFLDKFVKHQLLHQKILQKLEDQVPEEVFDKIKEAREKHLERFGEVMTKLEKREEKIRERIEESFENEKGSQFKNFKNLERLIEIEEKIPESAKEAIKQAQNNALKRLKGDLEGMSSQDQERFKEYLENISGDKNLQLQILEKVREKIENKQQLKEKLEEAREKIEEKIQDKIQQRECKTDGQCPQIMRPCIQKDDGTEDCPPKIKCLEGKCIALKKETKVCTALWDPVCGKDKKTYSNDCFAKIAGIEVDYKGKCRIEKTKAEECIEQGGVWKKWGLALSESCNFKTTDYGKLCTDKSQCQGQCIGENEESTSGKCSEWKQTYGCYAFIQNGKVLGGILCVD